VAIESDFKINLEDMQDNRVIKIISEYLYTQKKLKDNNIENTIVQFGSARIVSKIEAQKGLEIAKKNNVDVKIWEDKLEISRFYEDAKNLAYKFAIWNKENKSSYYLCSGGGPGIMEATNLGAFNAGEKSLGFNIMLPFEQGANPYVSKELSFDFNYFFLRKFWFSYLAKAFVIFPGGFGTLDELFENLTLIQTNKIVKKVPVVLFGKEFFNNLFNLDLLVKYSLIKQEDLDTILITDSIEEAFNYVISNIQPYDA
jgi:uncharacterized protein (TIGR00730 family)